MPEFLTPDQLAARAREAFEASDDTQDELADAIGSVQPEVSRALKGENQRVAKRIVEHYTGRDVEPGYVVR